MREAYPTRVCPPTLFEHDKDSKLFIKSLMEIQDTVLNKKKKDYEWATEAIMAMVDMLVGRPEPSGYWAAKYHDMWLKIIVDQMRAGKDDAKKFIDSTYTTITNKYLDKFAKEASQETIDRIARLLYNPWTPIFCLWHAAGRRMYFISKGLSQKLRQTKLKGYPANRLNIPFDALYIDTQDYGHFMEGAEMEGAEMEGCMVYRKADSISIALVIKGTSSKSFPRVIHIEQADNTIERELEIALERYKEGHNIDTSPYKKPWKEFCSYVVNIILYSTMHDAESTFQHYDPNYTKLQKRLKKQKSPQKREKIKQQIKKTSSAGYTLLGGSIKVDRTEERAETYEKGQRKITVRTLVSGHWRDQPCGKDRMDRKRIWIEPFWRGPEGAPITQKRHHLQ